jgi:hypothetical protein
MFYLAAATPAKVKASLYRRVAATVSVASSVIYPNPYHLRPLRSFAYFAFCFLLPIVNDQRLCRIRRDSRTQSTQRTAKGANGIVPVATDRT